MVQKHTAYMGMRMSGIKGMLGVKETKHSAETDISRRQMQDGKADVAVMAKVMTAYSQ